MNLQKKELDELYTKIVMLFKPNEQIDRDWILNELENLKK